MLKIPGKSSKFGRIGRNRPISGRIRLEMSWNDRISSYDANSGFPKCLFMAGDGRCVGIFIMGNDYHVKSGLYGGYPPTYLRRMKCLFPDKKRPLHLFAGAVNTDELPGITVDSNPDMMPDYVDNAESLEKVPFEGVDVVYADPPYSAEDAEHYGTPMVNRNNVLRALARKLKARAHVVWLDQVLPMYRKDEWAVEALIGMCKSTNHRFRMITVFRRLENQREAV